MPTPLQKRLQKELKEIGEEHQNNPEIKALMLDGNLYHWKGTILGPKDTPFAGGTFVVDIQIPNEYPYNPPKMKFDTKIWHPNVSSQTGAICLDILKTEWSPALTIRTALLSIQALLTAAEPDDPQDAEVAKMYKTDRALYNQTAKFWTDSFARADQESSEDQKIRQLTDMGFSKEQAVEALKKSNWDPTSALNTLLA
uniref:E2 ubiquitin-conjugating enzyme n=1 Tax=Chromera velia CCMP2878 TaxID=1169474 RepID=A0A0G4GER7_9ALVE|mmetsp:Transcript_45618/g.89854  ORF Transcript_45618/g.89854 Transcript_45618/m.89854 type:complete len:198 (-) Transcript_45618:478-1071(-)|eukprot:Cvel_4609.t1-p1 / transcript=Cvel_4609.t1 / gene=Cvel_4609 / organism=Chromera_velia_CCMP2878 / gene_product=Ubiquitin-conjugating enzyme E2 27, putative / transcript_product=Ubiquitin-conjugating enzyme E2 27, putative / location=Cvel_scaffold202:97511-100794(+) / protein_length=197 / sequence_SO=supercontig / SO=protein_coding / is_pseudo=false